MVLVKTSAQNMKSAALRVKFRFSHSIFRSRHRPKSHEVDGITPMGTVPQMPLVCR